MAVAYFALGGTISMTGRGGTDVVARLTGDELLGGLGHLALDVEVHTALAVPSAALTFTDVLDVARLIIAAAEDETALGRTWNVPSNPAVTQQQALTALTAPDLKVAPKRIAWSRIFSISSGPRMPSGKPGKFSTMVVRVSCPPGSWPSRTNGNKFARAA